MQGNTEALIDHQDIICWVAFPPEAGGRSLLLAAYRSIRLTDLKQLQKTKLDISGT
jgi:hypothetical protein